MKMFEQNSIRIGKTDDGIVTGMAGLSDMAAGRRRLLTAGIGVKQEVTALHELPKHQSREVADKT